MINQDLRTIFGKAEALKKVLQLRIGALLWLGFPCTTMIWISRSVMLRSKDNPNGNTNRDDVREVNHIKTLRSTWMCFAAIEQLFFFFAIFMVMVAKWFILICHKQTWWLISFASCATWHFWVVCTIFSSNRPQRFYMIFAASYGWYAWLGLVVCIVHLDGMVDPLPSLLCSWAMFHGFI